VLELAVNDANAERLANVIFTTVHDRRGRTILSVRDQNTFAPELRRRRLMTLMHLFLIHRYRASAIHYLTPTDDNRRQCERMLALGIFQAVNDEVGDIIVADVSAGTVRALVLPESPERERLIVKGD
jgi:isocitrate lyase